MLHLDLPTPRDLAALSEVRTDACVSIHLPTTPITQDIGGSRIELANLTKDAVEQLRSAGADKRRIELLREELNDLADDDDYWRLQAHSLAIFATRIPSARFFSPTGSAPWSRSPTAFI